MGKTGWLILGLCATGLIALIIWLSGERPGSLDHRDDQIHLVALLMVLLFVGSGFWYQLRKHSGLVWLKYGVIWIGLGVLLVGGYSLREDFGNLGSRMAAELMPGRAIETAPGTVVIRAGSDGHFHLRAVVDGTKIPFLVDTGATSVVLSPDAAQRMGIDLAKLSFSLKTRTANGIGHAAPIRLREIRIGPISVRNIPALVNRAPMNESLLGVSFLSQLKRYAVAGETLTLIR
ncbi:MAG: TIGR02281 family clan AA aspartic protease [Alphaproteobacteria bacterium]|nr:TIGR02281 family clan AA aspartic protease [Alphaproteobacteria bacterium]